MAFRVDGRGAPCVEIVANCTAWLRWAATSSPSASGDGASDSTISLSTLIGKRAVRHRMMAMTDNRITSNGTRKVETVMIYFISILIIREMQYPFSHR